jgi:hypothetical protein
MTAGRAALTTFPIGISVQCFVVNIMFLTNYPTPWNRGLIEKVIIPQLVKIFPKFCGTVFITAFPRVHHLSVT